MKEEEPKRGPGRPRVETRMNPKWKEIIIQAGKDGQHITHFLKELNISFDTHCALKKRNYQYSEAVKEYEKFCEDWWFSKARESVEKGESNKFNQRLWTVIMKNKFRHNWQDEKQVDITSGGEKLQSDNKIQVEIIKTKLEGDL
jgi:hypothetical protein